MRLSSKSVRTRLLIGASALALAMSAGAALAQDREPITIAPQSLTTALQQFGSQTATQVMFSPVLIASKKTAGVSAVADEKLALAQLLEGTGLTFRREGNVYLIEGASDPQSGSAAGDGAEGTVQALIVTAQKREENIQDVPIAMSAFTQEDLTKSQVAGGPDLMTQVPNFTFTKTNFSGYSIQIRGIGTQAISVATDPAVAVAFNNTPFIRNRFFEQEFYDLERVEVLRGPQGTLYGRNATAGVVNLISAKPKHEFEARLSADVSNYSSHRLEGMINIPLVEDKAALRIAGAWTKRDGFVKNTITGDQTDGRDLWSTRVTLGLEPTDKLSVNLIWEHFNEHDDRLRSGKQLCHRDSESRQYYDTQGCSPASLYSPDSFEVPNSAALPYYGPISGQGGPANPNVDVYLNHFQSRNLRDIETRIKPEYDAKSNILELQLKVELPHNMSFASETGYNTDYIFSFEDYNRFNTSPHAFVPGTPTTDNNGNPFYDIVGQNGIFCDPQLGCSDRMMAGDLDTAKSRQFSQEFRLSSDFEGPFNFSLGTNFLRYDTEEKYYVFINNITGFNAVQGRIFSSDPQPWVPGVTDNSSCVAQGFYGPAVANPDTYYIALGCGYIDPNDIHHLNDNGRNYFLSKNPYHLISYAAFGEAYYNITPNLKLTAGLRWTVDQKTSPEIPSWLTAATLPRLWAGPESATYGLPVRKVIHQEWREPTGRLALDWKPKLSFTDETLIYGSYVRGYKAGGANPPPPVVVMGTICPPQCDGSNGTPNLLTSIQNHFITHPETFKPEFVNAYEVGTKNTLLDGRLTANLAAFYYDYTGYQISEIVDRSASNLNFDAKIWGGELELDWRPLENLRLGFKGGYENTRVAKGMKAIDLMDRTAGRPGWTIKKPFPTMPSNCVFPVWVLQSAMNITCATYLANVDPVTYLPYVPNPTVADSALGQLPPNYPGFDPASDNYGEGFYKDLSGHQLPNAPKFTATITADYTIPLPNDWLATLHADLYRQSEAWTRIFNDPGYDKLKAYNNVNLAAIFSNEDRGWQVMAYVKNVLNKDNITGAFLNSDDTGLTTNVFLNEPRLYGIRVTKNWSGGAGPFGGPHTPGAPYPFTVELGGQMLRTDGANQPITPYTANFPKALDPGALQRGRRLDWVDGRQMRISYQPVGSPWKLSSEVRYGRVNTGASKLRRDVFGEKACALPHTGKYAALAHKACDPDGVYYSRGIRYNWFIRPDNRVDTSASRAENHTIADFTVGKDVGLGMLGEGQSTLSAGIRYAQFRSLIDGDMQAAPDWNVSDGFRLGAFAAYNPSWEIYRATMDFYVDSFEGDRKFKGAGPIVSWDASKPLLGREEAGSVTLDWSATGGVLFGRQKTKITGRAGSDHVVGQPPKYDSIRQDNPMYMPKVATTPFNIARDAFAKVPVIDLSLGLSYRVPGVKIGAGYRWERYFNIIDGGYTQHNGFDRTIDGPYVKFSLGFGG